MHAGVFMVSAENTTYIKILEPRGISGGGEFRGAMPSTGGPVTTRGGGGQGHGL